MKKKVFILSLLVAATACSQRDISPAAPLRISRNGIAAEQVAISASSDTGVVQTPVGPLPRACVHQVPAGDLVEESGRVTRPDKSIYQINSCPSTMHSQTPWSAGLSQLQGPAITGWLESSWQVATAGFREIDARWVVPHVPYGTMSGSLYYAFPGLTDSRYVTQPVLQYGYNGLWGGDYYTLASWKWHDNSDCTPSSTHLNVTAGDVIQGSITSSGCVTGTSCNWTITATDSNTASSAILNIAGSDSYTTAWGGVVEVDTLNNCDSYPPPSISFGSIKVYDNTHTQITPSWSTTFNSTGTPQCGYGVSTTSTTTVLSHLNPNLTILLAGSGLITSSGTHSVGNTSVINYSLATAFTYTWLVQYCYATPCSYGNSTDGSHTQFATGVGLTTESMNFADTDVQRDVIVVVTEYTGGTGRSGWTNHLFTGPAF